MKFTYHKMNILSLINVNCQYNFWLAIKSIALAQKNFPLVSQKS